jgi:hypothetical protein
VLLFDLLLAALAAIPVAIALTGGGVIVIAHHAIGLRSPDNLLIALAVLLPARYRVLPRFPLFGRSAWTKEACERRAKAVFAWIDHPLRPATAARYVVLACIVATMLKGALAAANPGFFSGDDVEVQEMSVSALWHVAWPVWDLRNATFPMGVVYPLQWVFWRAGAADPAALVWAGRCAVAIVSSASIWLVWKAARRMFDGAQGWALAAALLFAAGRLQMAFGSSELPRPVSTVFVLAAFVWLPRARAAGTAAAGFATGIAASLRFSEAVFVLPACVQLARARRFRDAIVFAGAAAVTAIVVLGATDLLYWGTPFHSARAIVDFTLVHRLSSRGYEGPLWYLLHAPRWISPPIFVLAVLATLRQRLDAAWWAWLPIVALSLLPHKEARYLIPVAPFMYLLAVDAIRDLSARAARVWMPSALTASVVLGLLFDAGHWRLPRSNDDVALARVIAAALPPDATLAAEQRWRLGGHLYFGAHPTVDLAPLDSDIEAAMREADGVAWVVLDSRSHAYQRAADALGARGYRLRRYAAASTYRVWTPK